MTYQEAMAYMESVSPYGIAPGLESIRELLGRLGNPQDRLRFVHVAGTNGKGSVCAYLSSILAHAGYRVGRYLSPAVFGYREKIQIIEGWSGEAAWISEENVARSLDIIKRAIEEMGRDGLPHPTPFEIETAMAFLEFEAAQCQAVVLEAGMGGRLDATNVIARADCAVLASIGMDHMAYLGNTLGEIAWEKAGIIKKGMRAVSYSQEPEAREALERKAREEGADLLFADFSKICRLSYGLSGTSFFYGSPQLRQRTGLLSREACQGEPSGGIELETRMLGESQPKNAAVAVEAALALREAGYAIEEGDIKAGIANARWPGRFSLVSQEPLVFADGAHNLDGAASLKKSMEIYLKGRKIFAVVGIFADKEHEAILSTLLPGVEEAFAIGLDPKRGLDSKALAEEASRHCKKATDAGILEAALDMAEKAAGKDGAIVCFGSLSFLGKVYGRYEERQKTDVEEQVLL